MNETGMILYKLFCRYLIRMEAASKLLGSPGLVAGAWGPAGSLIFGSCALFSERAVFSL